MNKRIKKVLALILAISVISTGMVYAYVPEIDDVPYKTNTGSTGVNPLEAMAESGVENSYELLKYLGIIKESKEELLVSEVATNALAADWFSRVLDQNSVTGVTIPYKDVTTGTKNYEGILRAYSIGIIPEGDIFGPAAKLTKENAARMAMHTVDYDILYKDSEALAFSEDNDLFKGVEISEGALTVGGLMRFVENTLNVGNVNYSITSADQYDVAIDENTSYLEKNKDIVVQRGVITGVDYTSIYDHSVVPEENIEINGGSFLYDGIKSPDMVGKNIEAYVDISDEKRVITIREYKNEVIEIDDMDFDNSSNGYINYIVQDKLKKARLSQNAKVIYNDLYFGTNQEAADNGKYTDFDRMVLIDNTNDDTVDIIKIYKSESYIVNRVSTMSERIDLLHGYDSINVNDNNTKVKIYLDGEEIGYETLVNSDVLSVYRADSNDGNIYYNIIVSREKITDVLRSKYEGEGKTYYNIAGEEYEITKEFIDFLEYNVTDVKPSIGRESNFLLTYDGRIAGVMGATSGFNYGYLMRGYEDENEEDVTLKMYSWTNGTESFKLKEKVKFYSKDYITGEKKKAAEVLSLLKLSDGSLLYDLIAYRINADSEIVEIAVPLDRTKETPGTIEYPLTKDYSNFKGEYETDKDTGEEKPVFENVRSYTNVIDSTYGAGGVSTLLFPFDTEARNDERQFNQVTFSYKDDYFNTKQLTLYNVDKFFKPSIITIGASVETAPLADSSAYMVANVIETINEDDEPCIQISYYAGNTLKTKNFAIECVSASDTTPTYGQTDPSNIKVGDIVQFSQDNLGNINSVRFLYKSDKPSSFGHQNPRSKAEDEDMKSVSVLKIIHGAVSDYSDKVVLIDFEADVDGRRIWPVSTGFTDYGDTTFTMFDTKTGDVKPIERNEIKKGDEVVLRKEYNYGVDFFIIR